MPVTKPVEEPTVAMLLAVLLHIPPVAVSVRPIVLPMHITEGPVMAPAAGRGLTVITTVATDEPHAVVIV